MNKTRRESVAHAVRARVLGGDSGRVWTYADFPGIPGMALAAALSRLAKTGELRRVRRGVYCRSEEGQVVEKRQVLKGDLEGIAEGSSSVSVRRQRRTSRAADELEAPSTDRLNREREVLSQLRVVTRLPNDAAADMLFRMQQLVASGRVHFGRLARLGRTEPPRVRAMIGALGDGLTVRGVSSRSITRRTNDLRKSLNPLTTYRIPGAQRVLARAALWRIR